MSNPLDVIRKADAALFEQMTGARELAFQEGALSVKHKILIAYHICGVGSMYAAARGLQGGL